MASLRGEPVDRPAVCLYEINGLDQRAEDPDPFNIHNDPSWRPLIELARDRSDRIVMRGVPWRRFAPDPVEALTHTETRLEQGNLHTTQTVRSGDRLLTRRTRRDPDVDTVWETEHPLKDVDDLRAYLALPTGDPAGEPDPSGVLAAEEALGETGIVLIDTPDPLCLAAGLFDMEEYTVVALTEPELFHALLERFAAPLWAKTEAAARALPGRLWRIYGPEYAAPPYLPPRLFREYVVRYVRPMIEAIQRTGGFARVHCHGKLSLILEDIAGMGADALDPIEPPPQGDVRLLDVRRRYGAQMTLFGNLESSNIESLRTDQMREKALRALEEGTAGEGRGFVLMPSACPYGQHVSEQTVANYEAIVGVAERF